MKSPETRPLLMGGKSSLQKESITLPPNRQSITVSGKGIAIKPRGYVLKKDAYKVDAPTLLLQSILDNKIILKELVANHPKKASILENAKRQINSLNQQEKVLFLKGTFAILSDPNPEHQNDRDAALGLLNIMDLKSINPKELTKTYIEAVSNLREDLNKDSDLYGEIHALLEAGKIIVPFIESSVGTTQAWNRVAKAFTGDDRQKILDDIKEIRQLIPKTLSEFDTKVTMFIGRGFSNQDIAIELKVTTPEIKRSAQRLGKRNMKPFRKRGTIQSQESKRLFAAVKDLRNKGMGNLEIANKLTIPHTKIEHIAKRLIAKGEIPRIKSSGPRKKV